MCVLNVYVVMFSDPYETGLLYELGLSAFWTNLFYTKHPARTQIDPVYKLQIPYLQQGELEFWHNEVSILFFCTNTATETQESKTDSRWVTLSSGTLVSYMKTITLTMKSWHQLEASISDVQFH